MAEICGNLWEFNLAKVKVIDVTTDYENLSPPLPTCFYPVIEEKWMAKYRLPNDFSGQTWVEGFLYDWHESPLDESGEWVIGVVDAGFVKRIA